MADHNQTPSPTSIVLSDSKRQKRAAPGRLPASLQKANPKGDPSGKFTPIGSGSPAAIIGQRDHELRRARPDLVSRRMSKGK
jgi:hypothetical protein